MRLLSTPRSTAGYTLIEVVTVLVLIAVIASLAAPAMSTYVRRHKAQRALDAIAADLALTRMLAVRNGHSAVVEFISEDTYRISVAGAPKKTVWLGQDFAGVAVSTPGDLTFNSRGLLTSPAMEADGGRITVSLGEDVRDTLTITPTGRIYREF